jgi:hypothetical protein
VSPRQGRSGCVSPSCMSYVTLCGPSKRFRRGRAVAAPPRPRIDYKYGGAYVRDGRVARRLAPGARGPMRDK